MTAIAGGIVQAVDVTLLAAYTSARPLVRLIQQASQTLTSGVNTAITFGAGSEDVDTHGYHDTSTNVSRITPQLAGYYEAKGTFTVAASTALTIMGAAIGKNASLQQPYVRSKPVTALSTTCSLFVCALVSVNGSTDYIELYGNQTSTGAASLGTQASGGVNSVLELTFLRPL